jgi:hypothetical protein
MGIRLNWRFINAGSAGTSHTQNNIPCQDSCLVEVVFTSSGEEVLVAIASDGAGSAAKAEVGSDFICSEIFKRAEQWLQTQPSTLDLSESIVEEWIASVRADLEGKARLEQAALKDYASTMLLAIVGEQQALYAQIGDGAIVVNDGDSYAVMFWPENGEYANMTYFLTDDNYRDHLTFIKTSSAPAEVAIFTDGLQRIALKYDTKTPYIPFFMPMFQKLRNAPGGMSYTLCDQLEQFLSSTAVNQRTDDDKTLLLATKVQPNTTQ